MFPHGICYHRLVDRDDERRAIGERTNEQPLTFPSQRGDQRTAESLEVGDSRQASSGSPATLKRFVPVRKIKETRLSRHHRLRCRAKAVNQLRLLLASGFSKRPVAPLATLE